MLNHRVRTFGLTFGLTILFGVGTVPAAQDQPNIVLIMADDQGAECIRAHGGESYETPRIDQLAAAGMRFDHAFANPLCTPSRVKIMTGMYNVRNYASFGELPGGERTFAHQLKTVGYATAVAGKWQLGHDPDAPQHFGFDQACLWQHTVPGRKRPGGPFDSRFVNPILSINGEQKIYDRGEYGPDVCADFLIDFMEQSHRQGKPFLAYYPMILTHCPFDPTPLSEDWDPTRKGSKSYKGPGGAQQQQKHFRDMVHYTDRIVGRIIDKLEGLGIRENTLIIFTGDNGTDSPIVSRFKGRTVAGGKGDMSDEGTRVPFIASWPAVIEPGGVSDELVDFSDLLPTLCEAAGAPLPDDRPIDGVSLMPTLQGQGERDKPFVYVWYARNGKDQGARVFARTAEHKVLRRFGDAGGQFFHCAGPFDEKIIPADQLTKSQRQAKQRLVDAMDTIRQDTRGSDNQ